MDKFPFLGSSHTSLIEKMYEDYLKDSSSVHKQWRDFFQGYSFAKEVYNEDDIPSALRKEFKVIDLIEAYRKRGHLFTKTNPVWFLKQISPAQLLAFSTSSSAATLPVTMDRVEKYIGVDKEVSSFVLPVGFYLYSFI